MVSSLKTDAMSVFPKSLVRAKHNQNGHDTCCIDNKAETQWEVGEEGQSLKKAQHSDQAGETAPP